jgi:hypothetical protein
MSSNLGKFVHIALSRILSEQKQTTNYTFSEVFSSSSNNLTGDVSHVLSKIGSKIVTLSLADNLLEGSLGDSFCHLLNLGELLLQGKNFISWMIVD